MMNKLVLAAMIFLGAIAFSCVQKADSRGYIVKSGDVAPDFEMKLLDGSTTKLSQLKGKVVMLQFTASWCGVCRKEMPFIEEEIWQVYKDNENFALFALDRDEPKEKAEELISATGITYPMVLDEEARIFAKFAEKESGVTRNVIINKEGKIIFLTRLFNREEFDAMKKAITDELGN